MSGTNLSDEEFIEAMFRPFRLTSDTKDWSRGWRGILVVVILTSILILLFLIN